MHKLFAISGVVLIAATTSVSSADESLFSKVRTEKVFSPSDASASAKAKPGSSEPVFELASRVTSTAQLTRLMREAGFEPEEDADNRMVTTETKIDVWTFPVLVWISENERQLTLALLLSSTKDEGVIPKSKLLELLEANRRYAPAFFGYSAKNKRTELYHILENREINARKLADEIRGLAEIAIETEKLWDFGGAASASSPAATPAPESTSPSLVGRWSASRSKTEAFAIHFKADNTFLLVYVKDGKQTRSTGKFTVKGKKLSLEGKDGFRLSGAIESHSGKEFRFIPENSTSGGLTFKQAT